MSRPCTSGTVYRSGFWAIYLLSALAVLFGVMPVALGWDTASHFLHPFAGLWALGRGSDHRHGERHLLAGPSERLAGAVAARTHHRRAELVPSDAGAAARSRPAPATEANWYLRVFDPGQHLRGADDVAALCAKNEPLARKLLAGAWSDSEFISSYAQWTIDILEQQRHYHYRVANKQHALRHRVHLVNSILFAMTAFGALLHLLIHTLWLSLATMFFPALGSSLHGALAQSEAYRLETTSGRLVAELRGAIKRIREALPERAPADDAQGIKASIEAAIALILEEHQDWHLLVRPHNLPLA